MSSAAPVSSVAKDVCVNCKWYIEESALLAEQNHQLEGHFRDMQVKRENTREITLKSKDTAIPVKFSYTLENGIIKGVLESNAGPNLLLERRVYVNKRLCRKPKDWVIQYQSVITYPLDSSLPIYNEIKTEFSKINSVKIMDIIVIQNLPLYTNYYYELLALDAKGTARNERLLYHGSKVNPDILINSGFDVNYSSEKNLWGQGIYFTNNVDYAHKYAFRDEQGFSYLIICQVALGESFFYGNLCNPGLKHPPRRCDVELKPDDAVLNYDSVQGQTSDGIVQVIYNVDQIYPAYVVKYQVAQPDYFEGDDPNTFPTFVGSN